MDLKLKKIDKSLNNPLPAYATEHAAGMDITSSGVDDIILEPGTTRLIPTNLILEVPIGYEAQIRPRSGLALKHNIGIINSPGTIDADYSGALNILLTNFVKQLFTVKFAELISQMIIRKVENAGLELADELSDTTRSSGGFGHTGK